MNGETRFTLDMRGMPKNFSFADMAKLFDAFVKVWKHAPRTILVTKEQLDEIYPQRKYLNLRTLKYRDVELKEVTE